MRRAVVGSLLIGLILSFMFGAVSPAAVNASTIHHYEYVLTSGFIYVYDMDNGGSLVKRVSVPTTAGVRGAVASAATGMLYISYGSDGNNGGFQLAYNLSTDQVVWTMSYSHGIDSQSITPDGKKIYMPSGELASGGIWYVEDSTNGNDITTIDSGGSGPHNTIVSPNGLHVYMGDRDFNLSSSSPGVDDFDIASTATNQIVGRVTPLKSGARPFTINSKETFSFNTVTGFLGFQVGNLTTGNVIYTVAVDGSNIPGYTTQTSATIPSHGISLSPDDKEIYLVDQPNSYVHVFDVTGLPNSPPLQVADIKLVNPMSGNQNECAYDCLRDGWIQHSRDGRFVIVGDSGDVIDTLTRKTIATMPAVLDSRVEIEIDFQDSTPIWAATSRSGVGYVNPVPPTFTARITSPDLGSTVSGNNVTVSTSVIDSASISAVDLSNDGTLLASTSSSPYTFSWDTTKDSNGPHTLAITANDTAGNTTSFSATFTVSNTNTPNPPSITTNSLPSGTQKVAYNASLAASGGTTPYTWSIASGTLPAGLALAPSTGAISGTPTGSGTSNFTVKVTDANSQAATKALSLTINAAPSVTVPTITTASLPSAKQSVAYNATLAASGGTSPYTWTIASGTLPAGLALAPNTGAFSGIPTGTGTSNFTVKVTDSNAQAATKALSLTVSAAPSTTPPSITTTSLPSATQKVAYNASLAASGGTSPYIWAIASGTLPTGLVLAPNTGAISGTATGTGTSNFTVRVTDAKSMTATKSLSLTVAATASPSITATGGTPQGATIGTAFGATLKATAKDSAGHLLAGVTVTFTAPAQSGPSGTFAGGLNTATTNASGVATSTVFTANSIAGGPYDVTASLPGAATPAIFSLTNDPKQPASLSSKAGTPQRSVVNTALPTAFKVTVNDASGHPVPDVSVTFTAPSSGASGTFTGGGASSTATTDASGIATAPTFTTNSTGGGPYNVTASVAGVASTAAFSLTNVDFTIAQSVPGTVQVTPGTPTNVVLTLTTSPAGSTFPEDVNFSCTATALASNTTCTVNPTKISANSHSGITTTLTVTTAASLPPSPKRQDPRIPFLPWAAATALAGIMAIYSTAWQRIVPYRGRMVYLTLALLAISSAGLMGCVGVALSKNGMSSVTVTATSGGVSKTMAVNINTK